MFGLGTGTGGLSNLLSNKLLLQYLAAAGQDIGSGNPIGASVNAVTQQNISSQNFMNLLKKMLSGQGVPEGVKAAIDSKGMKLNIDNDAFNKGLLSNLALNAPTSSAYQSGLAKNGSNNPLSGLISPFL